MNIGNNDLDVSFDPRFIPQQVTLLWEHDGGLGARESLYNHHVDTLTAAIKRQEDYTAGFKVGVLTTRDVNAAIRDYKRRRHAQVIDIGIFRVGLERGRFISARQGDNTILSTVQDRAYRGVDSGLYADRHFLYNPFVVGVRVQTVFGNFTIMDVTQARIDGGKGHLFLAPGTITGQHLGNMSHLKMSVDHTMLHVNQQPVLDYIPPRENLIRVPPSPKLHR